MSRNRPFSGTPKGSGDPMSHPANSSGNVPPEATTRPTRLDRRRFLQMAGGAVALSAVPWAGRVLVPEDARAPPGAATLSRGGTDGWIYLPRTPAIPPFHPDTFAPAPFTT